jgi:hypothetical protein
MSKYNLKLVAKPVTVKVKPKVKQQPQYDERGLLLNPTEDQLLESLKESAEDLRRGDYIEATCVADIMNHNWN